ncbi:hypothetical protein E1B28_005655 [Marasmius oreades]|uniref:Uncharacterized protein n=1 Tax=Marasmius oreades TaxID=181124 RepID=A0A9P7UUG9_9AGAR|nr:uncharacterized protein E1B28_005655 [Marasmius oreades]KAG7094847.1 hypothetical protein E1B28_005655 [Marasmius oreades]
MSTRIREEALTILCHQFGLSICFNPFLKVLTTSIDQLQAALCSKSAWVADLEQAFGIMQNTIHFLQSQNSVFEHACNQYKNEAEDGKVSVLDKKLDMSAFHLTEVHKNLESVQDELKESQMRVKLLHAEKLEKEKMISVVSKCLVFVAQKAVKGGRGSPLHAFPEMMGILRRLCWEAMMTSDRLETFIGIADKLY